MCVPGQHPSTWELIMGEQDAVRLNVTAHNFGESAYDAWLYGSHPASLNYTAHKTDVSKNLSLTLSNNSNLMPEIQNTVVICDFVN